ncbi:MAG: Trm112 family protein [Burkholderiaceae bacterium]
MDKRLLDILVCPMCKGPLRLDKHVAPAAGQAAVELVCERDRLAFPVRDDIPVMLIDEARHTDAVQPT